MFLFQKAQGCGGGGGSVCGVCVSVYVGRVACAVSPGRAY